ncbi:metal-dependent transcriptional regulator [Gehongia tenuis]|uniref:Metal-dependent transcriptional regulator n=1 Tax=Gehongia tenuis TaxID=2763655 RepID=A0A926D3F4_9FIRM|nr:metal-dependent transcriptional regulator [Gehongia tenuis]MBC8531038.1 metal-dependent transcriptional regulator [Gehongia tenuis]
MKVMESGEDYLEMILMLQGRQGTVRSIDIASEMRVSRASVSVAMKNLRKGGYIDMGENHEIFLTPEGRKLAETMYERHLLFSNVLSGLGVERETALHDACRMEHIISAESFEALKKYFEKNGIESRANLRRDVVAGEVPD